MLDEVSATRCPCGNTVDEATLLAQLDEILVEYRYKEGGLIPVLQIAQGIFGYLPEPILQHIAKGMDKPYSEVAGVVGFYSYFSTQPRGENVIRVCLGTACYVRGGKQVLDAIKKVLTIDVGETTDDKVFSLEIARCFGACGLAPAIMINDDVHQRVKPARIKQILAPYQKSELEVV
jgi:NADH:ubiquinone oxidoreductase subunit E